MADGTRVWSWVASADEMAERRSHARRLVGLEICSVHYVNLDYGRDDLAPGLTGQRRIVDPAQWADPTWRYPDCDSVDYGLELGTAGGRVFSVTWDPPGQSEGIGLRESPLISSTRRADGYMAVWDVGDRSNWSDLLGLPIRDVVLYYLPWDDPPGYWCPRITLVFDASRVELLLGEGVPFGAVAPSADSVAVLFDPEALPPWEQSTT